MGTGYYPCGGRGCPLCDVGDKVKKKYMLSAMIERSGGTHFIRVMEETYYELISRILSNYPFIFGL